MGRTAVIIGNGTFPKNDYPLYVIREADYIVCCDGAADTFLRRMKRIFGGERLPDIIIGDLDSIRPATRRRFADITVHESEQEHNDQTKAVRYVIENMKDVSRIVITGATGKREEHTIGNLSLLMEYARMFDLESAGISIEMVSDNSTAFAITDSSEIHCGEGRSISIFSPDNSLNIKSEGLKWKTDGVVFDNWWKATLNKAEEDVVRLKFSHPSLALVILD